MAFRFTPAASLRYAQAISEGRILGIQAGGSSTSRQRGKVDRYRTQVRLSFLPEQYPGNAAPALLMDSRLRLPSRLTDARISTVRSRT
jgi:hypothetical protein